MSANPFFMDRTGWTAPDMKLWPPVVIPKSAIDDEIGRLSALPRPANGRRHSLIVHPQWQELGVGPGLAPGIRVTLEVLNPGEQSAPIRHNSTQVNFCILGGGHSIVGGKRIDFKQYDVYNFPSMLTYRHVNDTDQVQARFSYSNAPLLEKMNVHIIDEAPPAELEAVGGESHEEAHADDPTRKSPYGTFQLTDDGAWLMPYEILINPPSVESKALHWPWQTVKAELDKLVALGKDYKGRRLYLLWNPMTGRTNGTTPNFFATMTIRPGKIVDRPHRHISAAINYYFAGSGRSTVDGKVYEWSAGDLMLSAPGWGVHNHASYDDPVYELTIQDQPLNIMMESLLWQEDLKLPFHVLGAETGFDTNRAKVGAKR
ncbi:MAG: cupin domain-containing protein [Rhodospirillales bacterium]